ncbi:Kinesin-like protein KIF3A [Hondaea fermentalgiana]|uniref:Kinesin-like protein KIF3A n=1 Tax=Hondaea fermentalgiana TaxID=2315210 RepID=A0A2R5G630_9STRA|nr:Kinesin-like protein KIF3A [Hondaea fermentalgiana]|eukprot:GBG26450.1 Kinesin-like protein KIF3A [Hondaea fermentalgiana]
MAGGGGGRENIRVVVRIRPDEVRPGSKDVKKARAAKGAATSSSLTSSLASSSQARTEKTGASCVRQVSQASLEVLRGDKPRTFHFDRIFGPETAQEDVYAAVDPLVASTIKGYNATIFAYGSTGSGKTHTISGAPGCEGIIPRAVHRIFALAGELADREADGIVLVQMGYVELYNNQFKDLLYSHAQHGDASSSASTATSAAATSSARSTSHRIELHTTKSGSVFLSGTPSLHTPVTSAQEALRLIQLGSRNRAVGATDCNEHSSRSHAILTFYVESRIPSANGATSVAKLGKLHLVDLAGSERLTLSKAEGQTLTETQNINLSLSTLGDVLSALSRLHSSGSKAGSRRAATAADRACVPYRNSKLTFLLKDSLGGNSKTLMIATIRTPDLYQQQTLMTLMYAERAKKIENRIQLNTDTEGDSKAAALVAEVERLKMQLRKREADFERLSRQTTAGNGGPLDAASERHRMEQLAKLAQENELEKDRLEACLRQVVHNHASTLTVQQEKYSSLQFKLAEYKDVFDKQRVEIETLRESIRELANGATEDEVEEMKAMVEKLARALGAARQEALVQANHVKQLEHQLRAARERVRGQSSQHGAAQLQVDELRDQLKTSRHQYEALKSASVDTLRELERVRRAETAQKLRITALEQKQEQTQIQLQRAEQTAASSASEPCETCVATRSKYDAAIASLHEQIRETLLDKDTQLHELTQEREQLRAQKQELEAQKSSVLTAASEAQALAAEMQSQRDALRSQLQTAQERAQKADALEIRLTNADKEGARFKQNAAAERERREREFNALQHTAKALKSQLAEADARTSSFEEVKSALAKVRAQLTDTKRTVEQKASRLAELDAQLENERDAASKRDRVLHERLDALHKDHTQTMQNEKTLADALEALRQKHTEAVHHAETLERERNSLQAEAQGRSASLAQQLKDADAAQKDLRDQLLTAFDEAAKARHERDTALDRAETLIQQAKQGAQTRTAKALEALQAERDDANSKLQQAGARIDQVELALRKAETDRQEINRAAEERASKLQERLRILAKEKDDALAQVAQLQIASEQQTRTQAELQNKLQHFETQAAHARDREQALERSVEEEAQARKISADELCSAQERTQRLDAQLQDQAKALKDLAAQHASAATERDEALRRLDQGKEELAQLQAQLAGLKEASKKAQTSFARDNADREGVIATLEEELAKAARRNAEQSEALEVLRKSSASLEKHHAEQSEMLASLRKSSTSLAERTSAAEKEASKTREALSASLCETQRELALLQEQSQVSETRAEKLRNELAEAKRVHESLIHERDASRSQVESERAKLNHLRQELAQAQEVAKSQDERVATLSQEVKTQTEALAQANDKLAGLRAELQATIHAREELAEKEKRRQSEAAERAKEAKRSHEETLGRANDDLRVLEEQLAEASDEARTLRGELTRSKDDISSLEGKLAESTSKTSFLEETVNASKRSLEESKEETRAYNRELTRAKAEAESNATSLRQANQELDRHRDAATRASKELESQKDAWVKANEEIAGLKRSVQITQDELAQRDHLIKGLRFELKEAKRAHEQAVAALEIEFSETTRHRDEDLAKSQEELRKVLLAHDLATSKSQQDHREAQYAAEAELSSQRNRVAELEKQKERLGRESASNLAKEVVRLQETSARLTQAQSKLESKNEQVRDLQVRLDRALLTSPGDETIWKQAIDATGANALNGPPTSLMEAAALVNQLLEGRSEVHRRLDELSATCEELRAAAKDRESERVQELSDQSIAASTERESAKREVDSLRGRLKVQNEWVEDLKKQRASLDESLSASSREVERLRAALEDVGHIQQELGCLRAENAGLKAAHTDRLARAEATSSRLEAERRADQARLAQYAKKLEHVRKVQQTWTQDRQRVKRVMAEAMAGMYGSLEGVFDRLSQKKLGTRLARLSGHEHADEGAGLGEYKLGVLQACLRGDIEGLAQALSVGFIRSDFDDNFLPLHRTISGFHFHGSSERAIRALDLLVRKGAPVNARDVAGNTVLHKALQVVPGDSILAVLRALLRLGADVKAVNKLGDTPVHTELRRLRNATPAVVRELVAAGARSGPSQGARSPIKVPAPAVLLEAILREAGRDASRAHLELLEFLRAQNGVW